MINVFGELVLESDVFGNSRYLRSKCKAENMWIWYSDKWI